MNYLDMLNSVAFENAMMKSASGISKKAKGLASLFNFIKKNPDEIRAANGLSTKIRGITERVADKVDELDEGLKTRNPAYTIGSPGNADADLTTLHHMDSYAKPTTGMDSIYGTTWAGERGKAPIDVIKEELKTRVLGDTKGTKFAPPKFGGPLSSEDAYTNFRLITNPESAQEFIAASRVRNPLQLGAKLDLWKGYKPRNDMSYIDSLWQDWYDAARGHSLRSSDRPVRLWDFVDQKGGGYRGWLPVPEDSAMTGMYNSFKKPKK